MAVTTFDEIYDRFLSKVTDYELAALLDTDLNTRLKKYLKSAISDFLYCQQDLSDRNEDSDTFNITLTESEQSILAKFMVVQWVNPQILRLENVRNELGNRDFQTFSPGNLLDKLSNLKKDLIREATEDMIFYHYNNLSE
jgi:hypothetical protein